MNKLRFCFSKEPSVKYIGHLDLIEVFDRAFRRAKLPISFSGGFNPRPKLSFAHPLAVGISSFEEMGEVELNERVQETTFIDKLNKALPVGIRIVKAYYTEENKSLMSLVCSAEYRIELIGKNLTEDKIKAFFNQKEILIDKKNKKGQINSVNVKELIFDYKVDGLTVWARLSAGNEKNLRPDILISKLDEVEDFSICRQKINLE